MEKTTMEKKLTYEVKQLGKWIQVSEETYSYRINNNCHGRILEGGAVISTTEGPKPEPSEESIQSYKSGMSEYFRMHDYRAMYDLWNRFLLDLRRKLTASESRVKELEALVGELALSLEESNELLKEELPRGKYVNAAFEKDNKLIAKAKALKP